MEKAGNKTIEKLHRQVYHTEIIASIVFLLCVIGTFSFVILLYKMKIGKSENSTRKTLANNGAINRNV